jgi:WD40 repeat protein
MWDARSGKSLIGPLRHSDIVASAQFSFNGRRIVTASMDYTACIWDADSGQALTEPLRHGSGVESACFSPDGNRIATASNNGTARLFDARTGQPLTEQFEHADAVISAQFSPDGTRIVTASADGAARVWDVAPSERRCPDWLRDLAEAISGRVLNKQSVLEQAKLNRAEVLNEIRQKLDQEPADNDWIIWGRWFLADRSTRTISPFSGLTVPEYIKIRIKENTAQSLHQAEQLAFGNLELLERISAARKSLGGAQQPSPKN